MVVLLVIVLAVIAAVAIVIAIVDGTRLRSQRALTASAHETLATRTAERDAATAERDTATTERDTAIAEREAASARAADAESARDAAVADADEARARVEQSEARAAEAAGRNGVDPQLLWSLEQARTQRTWRQSVALGEGGSFLDGADDPLREAIQVELDAAREDVGAVVELDAELPATVTPAGSVLVLRAAQELLAHSVKAAEETTLRIRTDGEDVLVTVDASDEDGQPVVIATLAIPASADMEAIDGGVRIRRAVAGIETEPP
jgi:FtsZ-interacting cell division protein ZipA